MKVTMTPHGLQSVHFLDQAGNPGLVEQSAAIDHANPTWDRPGSSYLLLGAPDSALQLNIEQVGELVEYLERWLEQGSFVDAAAQQACREAG